MEVIGCVSSKTEKRSAKKSALAAEKDPCDHSTIASTAATHCSSAAPGHQAPNALSYRPRAAQQENRPPRPMSPKRHFLRSASYPCIIRATRLFPLQLKGEPQTERKSARTDPAPKAGAPVQAPTRDGAMPVCPSLPWAPKPVQDRRKIRARSVRSCLTRNSLPSKSKETPEIVTTKSHNQS